MKNKDRHIEKEVQRTLDSTDTIQRVEGNPFLFAKLQERLNQQEEKQVTTRRTLSPAWQIAAIGLLFFINGFILLESGYFNYTPDDVATIDDLASEYSWTELEEENLDYLNLNE